ncbi:hypothetical protein GCM10023345_28720 [Acinetobacter kookii]|uniref:HicB family protein n=1 Tax=Acinetobacter kookii TaxID=1226327 RepID=A0A1G6GPA8_9GAMM|nr:toxin-antitoxin system HicB family antitoxin [Acinetobacter kookii]SDB83778.1 HicB family protein [Acinetobacter kookii]
MTVKQIHIKLADEIHKQLKMNAVLQGISLQDLVSKLIEDYVAEEAKKTK